MSDPTWQRIYADGLPGLPPVSRFETPLVRNPECPQHCARHHVEDVIGCPKGHGGAFHAMAHEWPWSEGHYWYSYDPVNGATRLTRAICIDCGAAMTRR